VPSHVEEQSTPALASIPHDSGIGVIKCAWREGGRKEHNLTTQPTSDAAASNRYIELVARLQPIGSAR
jgi:hypothetical protein